MTIAQRIGQLAREQELTQRCAKFFDVARYVALEKGRIDGAPAEQTFASERIQQILKSVVAAGSTTGWGLPHSTRCCRG